MGLESAGIEFINQLVDSNPASGDVRAEGDDHLRLIKRVLKHSFPNFTAAMTRTAAELNAAPVKTGAETISGAWAFTAPVTVPVGSPSAPSIAFAGDSNTGMYSEGANVVNIATEGVERVSVTGTAVMLQQPLQASDGTVSLPSLTFKDQPTTGFYRSNSGEVSYSADGNRAVAANLSGLTLYRVASNWTGIQFVNTAGDRKGLLDLDSEDGDLVLYPVTGAGAGVYGLPIFQYDASTGAVHYNHCMRMANTSAVAPAYSFQSAAGSGLWSNGGAQVGLAVDGTNHFTFTASGLEGPATGVSSADNRYSTNAGVKSYVDAADALKADLASPVFTGNPQVPNQTQGDSDTSAANTSFVTIGLALKANIASPTFTGVPAAPTAAIGTDTTQLATTEYVVNALTEIASYDTLYNAAEVLPIGAAAEIGGWDTATNATAKYSEVTGATDGRMTVATTGTYRIDFCANFATVGFEALVIELRKNGSALTRPVFTRVTLHSTENGIDNASISVLVDASAYPDVPTSQYFSLYSSGLTTDTVTMTNAHFTVQRVR